MRLIDADGLMIPSEEMLSKMVIDFAPTIDAVPVRHGKWIDGHCSLCGCDVPAYIVDWKWIKDMNAKYCPMCGARMDDYDFCSWAERKEE